MCEITKILAAIWELFQLSQPIPGHGIWHALHNDALHNDEKLTKKL